MNKPLKPKTIKIYKDLIPLGLEESIMISDLIDQWVKNFKNKTLDEDGFFHYPRKNISQKLGIGKNKQKEILNELISQNLIEMKIKKNGKMKINKRLIRLNKHAIKTAQIGPLEGGPLSETPCLTMTAQIGPPFFATVYIYNILLYYIYYYNNTNVLLSTTNVVDNKYISISSQSHDCELINFFNSFKNLRKHNKVSRGNPSKTYKRCLKFLKELRKGTFYNKNKLDPHFLDIHNIPNPANKKFINKEIKRGFKNLSLLVENDYGYVVNNRIWPSEKMKSIIKKSSIDQLLFNRISSKSWFLLALYNKPKKFSEQEILPFDKKYLEIFSSAINEELTMNSKRNLIYAVKSIMDAQDFLYNNNRNWNGMSLGYKNDPENFLRKYIWFIKNELEYNNIKINIIKSNNIWNSFCDFLKDEFFLKNIDEKIRNIF